MAKIFLIVTIICIIIGLIWGPEVHIEWIIYLGIPLILIFGSAGLTFVTERIEAIIVGLVLAALWPVLWDAIQGSASTLP